MDYSSSMSSSGDSRKSKSQLMEEVRSQVAIATAQELIQKVTHKCFIKCVHSPGSDFDSREKKCLQNCVDRYLESWNLVSRTYSSRLQKDSYAGGAYGGH
ncbi:mitochondrial import inner membrane translocase subunit Tim13-like [Dysidea avara]|uniref:mitochondrial import inner membrane translocase subunit Tim13-like n=1 Tax=Dysidea avara TaxID=196820 RepID=UPI00331F4369